MVLTAAHTTFSTWPGWTPLGVISAAVIGLVGVWFAARPFFQKQRLDLTCWVTPLAVAGRGFGDRLRITWDGGTLDEPQVATIRLASRSAKDISPETFASGAPLIINVGAQIVALLSHVTGEIEAVGDEIRLYPRLIRRNQVINLDVLVDGEPALAKIVDPPLVDVEVSYVDRPRLRGQLPVSAAWLVLLFCISALADLGISLLISR